MVMTVPNYNVSYNVIATGGPSLDFFRFRRFHPAEWLIRWWIPLKGYAKSFHYFARL